VTSLPAPIVDAGWLGDRLGEVDLVVADVRWVPGAGPAAARASYEEGHIPGAVFLGVDDDLSAPAFEGPGRHPLPTRDAFARTMAQAGIGDGTAVVAYDDARGSLAARLWWMLDTVGERSALLDGGLSAWTGDLEKGPGRTPALTSFTARPWPAADLVDAGGVASAIADGSAPVLDARMPERFRGEVEPLDPVAGHIPGARGAPWVDNLDPATGLFRSRDRLRARYRALGVGDGISAIAHCGSGVTACHDLLAMRLAGFHGRLYEGSWSDWVHAGRPVATGGDPGGDVP
jgi:thiosulfate/3-mercaptopyruvate sulfurtransferase